MGKNEKNFDKCPPQHCRPRKNLKGAARNEEKKAIKGGPTVVELYPAKKVPPSKEAETWEWFFLVNTDQEKKRKHTTSRKKRGKLHLKRKNPDENTCVPQTRDFYWVATSPLASSRFGPINVEVSYALGETQGSRWEVG